MNGVFGRDKIIDIAKSIPSLYPKSYPYKEGDRALFCFLYLTGARVEEGVMGKKKVGVKKKDLKLVKVGSKDFLVVSLYTLKNRKHPTRKVSIPVKRESVLVNYVLDYVEKLNSENYNLRFHGPRLGQVCWVGLFHAAVVYFHLRFKDLAKKMA
jgi:site-specific recombinase XerD